MRVALMIYLPEEMHRDLKVFCALREISMSKVARTLLREWLVEQTCEEESERLDSSYTQSQAAEEVGA